jgi:tetratricopeptide (TPR) repeat protein
MTMTQTTSVQRSHFARITHQPRLMSFLVLMLGLLLLPASAVLAQRGEGGLYQSPVTSSGYRSERELDAETIAEIEDIIQKARVLTELGKFDSAVQLYYRITDEQKGLDPGNLAALEGLLKIFFRTNNWAMVISTLERIIVLKPDNAMLREVLLIVYRYYQMPERELPVELELVAIEPQRQDYVMALAETLNEYGFYTESIKMYERLHDLDATNTRYLKKLAQLYEDRAQPLDSLRCYEKIVALAPQDRRARMKLAVLYRETEHLRQALDIYEAELAHTPTGLPGRPHQLLATEIRYVHHDLGHFYFSRDRLHRAKTHFALAAHRETDDAEIPPFADAYLQDVTQAMDFKTFYDYERADYTFNNDDITRTFHRLGLELRSFHLVHRPRLSARTCQIANSSYDFGVQEVRAASSFNLGLRVRTRLSLGYSAPEDELVTADDEVVYSSDWTLTLNPRTAVSSELAFGVSRERVYDTVAAVERNIFKRAYRLAYSRYFFNKLWTVGQYRYTSFTGDNSSHFASFDLAYTLLERYDPPEDPDEEKPPLISFEKQRLGVGANLEYVAYHDTTDLYFTIDEEIYAFARAEYARTLFKDLHLALYTSYGYAFYHNETIADNTVALTYRKPFRLNAELAYTISDVTSTENGVTRTHRDNQLQFHVLFYF